MTQAQSTAFRGWFFSDHTQSLGGKWSFLSDIQLRSSSTYRHIETLLLRPGIEYEISKAQAVALGYAYLFNWEDVDGKQTNLGENRLWEQYRLKTKCGNTELNNRLRLEQRFVEDDTVTHFSQRLRYYLQARIPLVGTGEFKRGMFVVLQNELFVNITHPNRVNDHYFDQNRAYAAVGFRFAEAVELEAGYLFRYQLDEGPQRDHILQVVLTTSF